MKCTKDRAVISQALRVFVVFVRILLWPQIPYEERNQHVTIIRLLFKKKEYI